MSNIRPWKELSRKVIFDKYWRKVEEVIFKLPNGATYDAYIKVERPCVNVVGITVDNKVVLVKQYRPGPKEILEELPGGLIEDGEDPGVAARREFVEETGYDGDFAFAGTCIDDAYSTLVRTCYVATNCKKVGEVQSAIVEQTEVVLLTVPEFRKHLRTGKLTDTEMGYIGLDYLSLL